MSDINSQALREINHEYRVLQNKYLKFQKISTLFETIKKGIFFETLCLKINRRKYYDSFSKPIIISSDGHNDLAEIKKTAVYMCVVGKYDSVYEPVVLMDNADYFIITDLDIPSDSVWKKIPIDKTKFSGMSYSQINRYYKIHPHEVFPEYDYSIYIDGNIRILEDVSYYISKMQKTGKTYGVFLHPDRNCIYTEANYLMRLRRFTESKMQIKHQVECYRKEGFPKHFGLYENTILFRKHNDEKVIKLMDEWWSQLTQHSFRDQISFPYVMWKNGWKPDDIFILGINLKDCDWVRYYQHC